MLQSYLSLSIGKTIRYNNKTLVSNTDIKIGSNRDINKDRKELTLPEVPNTAIVATWHDPVETTIVHNLKMLTEKDNDEKLAITLLIAGTRLIAYHFW